MADPVEITRMMPTIDVPLVDSANLDTIPEITGISLGAGEHVTVTPSSYASWNAMFAANPTKWDFLLTQGNYSHWGKLTLPSTTASGGGIVSRRKTVRYWEPGYDPHPVQRRSEAIIDGFEVLDGSGYWIFHGLTLRHPTNYVILRHPAHHIVFDMNLIDGVTLMQYGVRVMGASYTAIQRSVIRNATQYATVDTTGVQYKPSDDANMIGSRLIDNEIYNFGDSFQVTAADPYPLSVDREIQDTLVEGNDMYLDAAYHEANGTAGAENCIDVKAGSNIAHSMKFLTNRLWGTRRGDTAIGGSGSPGEAVLFHRAARNIDFQNNIVGECPVGIKEEIWPTDWPVGVQNSSRNTLIQSNFFHDIRRYHELDAGSVFNAQLNAQITANIMAWCQFIHTVAPDSGYKLGGPVFTQNWRVNTGIKDDLIAAIYSDAGNFVRDPSLALPYSYERKRWTGSEIRRIDGAR